AGGRGAFRAAFRCRRDQGGGSQARPGALSCRGGGSLAADHTRSRSRGGQKGSRNMRAFAEKLQPLGRALMLPIAVLPAAGLLLRLGQPDLLNIAFIAAAGDAIFSNLGLLFAIGVAVGLARENHGAAGLAGAVGFLVATRGAQVLIAVPPGVAGLAADAFKAAAIAKLSVPT